MTYRKTWFGRVLWFLYTVLCIALFIGLIPYFTDLAGNIQTEFALGLLAFLIAAALYWSIRQIAVRIRKKCAWKERIVQILECIVFLLIMAGAVFIRIVYLNYYASDAQTLSSISAESMEYYNLAAVTADGTAASMDYGLKYLYVTLLSAVLSFLGNKVVSAIFMQIFLQIIGMILSYAVTRKIAGRLPACIVMLYLTGSLCCLNMLTVFGPEWLFFDLYMLIMLIIVSFVKDYCANRIRKPLAIIGSVAAGALLGGLTYLDLSGASLLIVMLIVAVGKKTGAETTDRYNYSKGVNAAVIVCAYLSWALVWHGGMFAAAHVKGTKFLADITEQIWLCYRNSFLFTNNYPYVSDIYLIGLLIVPASFLIFEFFRSGKEQNYMPWILLCLVIAPTPLATCGEHEFAVLSLYIWAVLAGLGLQNCFFGNRVKVRRAAVEKDNTAADKDVIAEIGIGMMVIEENNTAADQAAQSGRITDDGAVVKARETKNMENQTSKPKYIENPLPLPKKHVAREMDYEYEVAESDMKYDISVPENDDFDVK